MQESIQASKTQIWQSWLSIIRLICYPPTVQTFLCQHNPTPCICTSFLLIIGKPTLSGIFQTLGCFFNGYQDFNSRKFDTDITVGYNRSKRQSKPSRTISMHVTRSWYPRLGFFLGVPCIYTQLQVSKVYTPSVTRELRASFKEKINHVTRSGVINLEPQTSFFVLANAAIE